jgi:two-component system, cell cycle sensor histidine kinase and response regulator CckA
MNFQKFEQKLVEARQQLQIIHYDAQKVPRKMEAWEAKAIAELAYAVEELDVAMEELRLQNEELGVTRHQLELERQRYQELFNLAPEAYIVTDERANIQEANYAAALLLNVRQKNLIKKPLDIFITSSKRDIFRDRWLTAIKLMSAAQDGASNKPFINGEISLQPRQKEPIPVTISVSASRDSQGVVSLRWLFGDLSDRKQTEQKIREQAALLDVTKDAIIVRDWSDRILFWNKGAERLYGWRKEETLQRECDRLLSGKGLPQLEQIEQELLAQGEWQGELDQITKSGDAIVVESRWTLMRDEENNPKSILIVNSDITQTKQLEIQCQRKQRLESIGTLVSGISHDLNNLLSPILTVAQLLAKKFPDADERSQEMFQALEINAKRGADLLKQILWFYRGVEGQRVTLDLAYLIAEIKSFVEQTFPKSIEIVTQVPGDLWSVLGDITQLHQVAMNLCLNARDAMPDGGKLTIAVENLVIDATEAKKNIDAKVGSYVSLSVSDTGCGISLEIMDRIYEPFFTTKEMGRGTGLGLSMVAAIVESHNGFIEIASEPGKGSTFKICLPAIETPILTVKEALEFPDGESATVLVVDDEAVNCRIAKTMLETYGYNVLTTIDGIEAIALYAQHQTAIEAVLIDMVMPSMDGASVVRRLKQIDPDVKIVAISGLVFKDWMAELLGTSVKAFLSKPYAIEELLMTLKQVT